MIINKAGAEFIYDGMRYRIGETIVGTAESEYEGLYGTITEIRDGADKETENETPDIYCSFDPPILPQEIQELEETFSDLYDYPKTLEDISLDEVIMAPSMVRPVQERKRRLSIFAVCEDWAVKGEHGESRQVFTDYQDAHYRFHTLIMEGMENGCISEWSGSDGFQVENRKDFYKCWLNDDYCENHYIISLFEETLIMAQKTFGDLGRQYDDEGYREDIVEQVESWENYVTLTEEQQKEFIQMPGLPERIHKALGRNDYFWESYWETVSEVAHAALEEYRIRLRKSNRVKKNSKKGGK